MTLDDFIGDNNRIEIISNGGRPLRLPDDWRPVLPDAECLVAIPDMHMFIHGSNLDNFKYGAEPMLDFIEHLKCQRRTLGPDRLRIYQLGDLYELRFPSPTSGRIPTEREIRMSHPIYDRLIRALHDLQPRLIFGNHDYENRHLPGIYSQYTDGSVYLEHGFSADRWWHFTNPLEPLFDLAMVVFREIRRMETRILQLRARLGHIRVHQHAAIGIISGEEERGDMPPSELYPPHQRSHFERIIRYRHALGNPIRICISGHTHYPYLDALLADGQCIYIDAGAWTDGRSDFVVVTNEEVAVCRYRREHQSVETSLTPLRPAI